MEVPARAKAPRLIRSQHERVTAGHAYDNGSRSGWLILGDEDSRSVICLSWKTGHRVERLATPFLSFALSSLLMGWNEGEEFGSKPFE
jgi:hypothetical protein